MKMPHTTKTLVAFLILTVSVPLTLRAELPDAVTEVLEANIEASGGREVLSSITSSRLKGGFSIAAMNMKGSSEIVQADPNKIYSLQVLPGIGRMVQAFDGEIGWAEDPMQGFRHLSEGEIDSLKQNDSFGDMLDFASTYSAGELLEDSEVDGVKVYVVKLTDADTGDDQTHYYSKESGLLVRIDTIADMGPMGKVPATMNIKEYGEQEGIKFPKLMEMTNAGMVISISFDTLEINPVIDDSLFAPPQ